MVTDPARKRRTDPGDPEICPVFDLHKAFSPAETQDWAAAGLPHAPASAASTARAGWSTTCWSGWSEIHARRPEFAARPDTVWDILREGSRSARARWRGPPWRRCARP